MIELRSSNPDACSAIAGGKVILVGEHAVVHGIEAIAAGIGLGVRATVTSSRTPWGLLRLGKLGEQPRELRHGDLLRARDSLLRASPVKDAIDLCLQLDLPSGAGLGSSASMGVAFARALLQRLGRPALPPEVYELAMHWERVFHGNPSGIDVAASAYGGWISFSRANGVRFLEGIAPLKLCVGHSGSSASTRKMVELVAQRRTEETAFVDNIFDKIGVLAGQASGLLRAADFGGLGQVMTENQGLLRDLGLSTTSIDALCRVATDAGALGAKLTGSGGGGCVIALAPGKEESVIHAWQKRGFRGFVTNAGVSEATE